VSGRDLGFERAIVEGAATGRATPVAVADLNAFAEQRAGTGPVRDHERRDMRRETLEELADARNYLVWWRTQPGADPARIDEALAGLAGVWELVAEPAAPSRRALADAIEHTASRWPRCRCRLHARMTDHQLVALGAGCTSPHYACPRLDAVRRRVLP
jgi:hypothetical protein